MKKFLSQCYSLAGIRILIRTNCHKMMETLNEFLPPKKTDDNIVNIKIIIIYRPSKIINKYINNQAKEFKLGDIYYNYHKEKKTYSMSSFGVLKGKVYLDSKHISWTTNLYLPPRTLFFKLILDPISLISPMFDIYFYHGSVVQNKRDYCSIFLGKSGSGKSTISYMLSKLKTINMLCDDCFVIYRKGKKFFIEPINTGVGILVNGVISINSEFINSPVLQYNEALKKVYYKNCVELGNEYRIKNFFFLNKSDTNSGTGIEKINPDTALIYYLRSQTSIGGPHQKKKLQFNQEIFNKYNNYIVQYYGLCNLEKLLKIIE